MKKSQIHLPDREAIVSGRFYPGSHDALSTEIDELSGNADKLGPFSIEADEELLALISPHAGYVFSGTVAASAFNVLRKIKDKKRIFLIGSNQKETPGITRGEYCLSPKISAARYTMMFLNSTGKLIYRNTALKSSSPSCRKHYIMIL